MRIVKRARWNYKIKILIDLFRVTKVRKAFCQREINLIHALKELGRIKSNQ